jgi:hypothetical protein
MVFSGVVGPFKSLPSALVTAAWIWFHLLHVGISNQSSEEEAVKEDALNKPWRPIPAGYITLEDAQALRRPIAIWTALASLAFFGHGAMLASLSLSLVSCLTYFALDLSDLLFKALYVYNEHGLSKNAVLKNLLNLFGYACFEWGATLVACSSYSPPCLLTFIIY